MFHLTRTFVSPSGFQITPIRMQGVGFIFLPKEFEKQLGYENLSHTIRQSNFAENTDYLVLRDSNLSEMKELLRVSSATAYPSLVFSEIFNSLMCSSYLLVLTESGLEKMLKSSRKPNAAMFGEWVSREVMPSIREEQADEAGTFFITKTFSNNTCFHITPIEMKGVGLVFLPQELEEQLGYEDLSNSVQHNDSFVEGSEYIKLSGSKLLELKDLLNRLNSVQPVQRVTSALSKHTSFFIVLTESGLYTAIILSRKPDAREFRYWVTRKVLPSIRNMPSKKFSTISSGHAGICLRRSFP